MGDEPLAPRLRALIHCLRDEGVAEGDLIGTCHVGLLVAALLEGYGAAVEELRALLAGAPPSAAAPEDTPFARWCRAASKHRAYFVVVWREAVASLEADSDAVFSALWGMLDTIEAERMVAALEAR